MSWIWAGGLKAQGLKVETQVPINVLYKGECVGDIHAERDDKVAKFWLDPIRLQNSGGFNRLELKQIRRIIQENQGFFMEAWNEYFGR